MVSGTRNFTTEKKIEKYVLEELEWFITKQISKFIWSKSLM